MASWFKAKGTVQPTRGYDAGVDADVLYKAMKGLGTDEKKIIDVIGRRTNDERQQIKATFQKKYRKELVRELKSELSGDFENVTIALMETPATYDAKELHDAMGGAGTDEKTVIEIVCSRTNAQLKALCAVYKEMFGGPLETDLANETSGDLKKLLVKIASATRPEATEVDLELAGKDAKRLANADRTLLDKNTLCELLTTQSYRQLRCIFEQYEKITEQTIDEAIEKVSSGDLKDALMAVVWCAVSRPAYFAKKLYLSMKGMGTDDKTLIRVIVTRSEVDMVQIKHAFAVLYEQPLENFIKGDTSGDYKKMLLALIGC